MSNVSPDQFNGYDFDSFKTPERTTHIVVSKDNRDKTWMDPVASMTIDGSQRLKNQNEQEEINAGRASHYTRTEPSGQMRWGGGTMEDAVDKVSWLGMNKDLVPTRHQPHILRAMLGVGVEAHGSIPHADSSLSHEGAATAKAMNRRYGVKPHPDNPLMHANVTHWNTQDVRNDVVSEMTDELLEDGLIKESLGSGSHREFSHNEVASASQRLKNISDSRRVSKKTKKTEDIPLPGME
jgi:hypothetical protein